MKEPRIIIATDGGARGNPGPAGIGVIVRDGEDTVIMHSEYLGRGTNNWAEYNALVRGLEMTVAHYGAALADRTVEARLDSELVVKQLRGEYRVKEPTLKVLHARVRELVAASFPHIMFVHISRENNADADRLANEAMDGEA